MSEAKVEVISPEKLALVEEVKTRPLPRHNVIKLGSSGRDYYETDYECFGSRRLPVNVGVGGKYEREIIYQIVGQCANLQCQSEFVWLNRQGKWVSVIKLMAMIKGKE